MLALQFVRSVPRWLLVRSLGGGIRGLATGPFSCVKLREIDPPPLPAPDWVRLRPHLCGICGSDLSAIACKGSPYFSPFVSTPFVPGHELVGTITEKGAAVPAAWAAGQRVVIEPVLGCEVRGLTPPCGPCASGDYAHCTRILEGSIAGGIQTGYCRSTGGGWSTSLVAHHSQLQAVPEGLSDEEAVLAEPFACALHAALKCPLDDKATLLVLGCGTIGLMCIAGYRAVGGRGRLWASARFGVQAELARRFGADEVFDRGTDSRALYEWVLQRTGGVLRRPELGKPVLLGGVPVVLDCVGSEQTIDDALRLAAPRGTVLLVGMPGIPGGVDWTSIWYKELNVQGVYAYGWEATGIRGQGTGDRGLRIGDGGLRIGDCGLRIGPMAEMESERPVAPASPPAVAPASPPASSAEAQPRRVKTLALALKLLDAQRAQGSPLKALVNRKYPLREYRRALDDAFHSGASGAFKVVFHLR
jgi:threonine dehydrogenase-like Zn-dependent dehydrogenase